MTLRKHDHTVGGRTAGGWRRTLWLTLGILALGMRAAMAQTFTSGSTGADGALNLTGTPPGTVIDFDPAAFTPGARYRWGQRLPLYDHYHCRQRHGPLAGQ
jgi:hypothetical protein